VIVDFENGDPDRPIVTGRVYNGSNMPPWSLPDNATQSGTLTRSEDGGRDNANAIRFEDRKGQEEVWIHAEKDLRIEAENNSALHVGHDRSEQIDGQQDTTVTKRYLLTSGERIELVTGSATLILEKNGHITLRGTQLLIEGSGAVQINGKDVDIN